MTPENWRRLRPEFYAALELATRERSRYVDDLVARDEQLGRQLASLLRAHEQTLLPHTGLGAAAEEIPVFSPGEILLDRFQIVRLLGSGGMGDVYETNDWETERIALKTVRASFAHDRAVLVQFRKEVRLARRVDGPHVCRIHELFLLPLQEKRPATAFLTMEFLEGVTLADRLRDRHLHWKEAEQIALQICDGLGSVHSAGLVHRDLKARNVMLSVRGGKPAAVLMDFGLAHENLAERADRVRSVAAGNETSPLDYGTNVDSPGPGTPQYMAPEQWERGQLTPATDVYALGLVLYELVTGQHPFEGDSVLQTVLRRAKPRRKPSSLHAGLPHRWDEVIDRCLSYEPSERFQSASEVAEALRSRRAGTTLVVSATKTARYHPWLVGVGALFCVSGLMFALWYQQHRYYIPSKDALRWYGVGMAALEEAAYYRAANAFETARNEDNQFILARARLADVWSELDYVGKAAEEIGAIEPASENRLRRTEQEYVEAIRAALHDRHHLKAIAIFQALTHDLPEDDKALGYVDLGREYERAGEIEKARAAYKEAVRRAPQAPVTYVRLGSLETRQKDDVAAEATLSTAATLYQTLASAEGMATVAYLRGQIASNLGHLKEAHEFLSASFTSASSIPNVSLEVQALTQISAIDEGPQAVQESGEALRRAQDNHLPYWEAEALLRQGNAYLYLDKPDFTAAEYRLQRSFQAAKDNGWPGLLGMAQLSLAALRDLQGKPDRELAQEASDYFRGVGFTEYAVQSLTLLARAEYSGDDFAGSLRAAQDVLAFSAGFKNKASIAQAEEAAGQALLGLERYPEALSHYEAALGAARQSGDPVIVAYEKYHCADAQAKLGEYAEAAALLDNISPGKDVLLRSEITRIRCQALESHGRYAETVSLCRRILLSKDTVDPSISEAIQLAGALAQAALGSFDQARRLCRASVESAQQQLDGAAQAAALRVEAAIDLKAGQPEAAIQAAERALKFFTAASQKESEWRTLATLAEAHERLNDAAAALQSVTKANSTLAEFLAGWSEPRLTSYNARPDISAARRELEVVASNAKEEGQK